MAAPKTTARKAAETTGLGTAPEVLRFFVVAVAGLALDLAVAWGLVLTLGAPLWLAAALGFVVAAAANYAAHELWTFRGGARRLAAPRALRYLLVLVVTLVVRVTTVAVADAATGGTFVLPVLLAGAAMSFAAHYLLSSRFVFHASGPHGKTAP